MSMYARERTQINLEYSFGELKDHVNLIREGMKYKGIHHNNIQGQKK